MKSFKTYMDEGKIKEKDISEKDAKDLIKKLGLKADIKNTYDDVQTFWDGTKGGVKVYSYKGKWRKSAPE